MLPGARKAVVNRRVIGPAGGACQPLGCVLDLEHDAALRLLEINIDHVPWRGQPECLCEACVHQQLVPSAGAPGKRASMGRIHTKRERAHFHAVIPTQAGIQCLYTWSRKALGPRLRGDDEMFRVNALPACMVPDVLILSDC